MIINGLPASGKTTLGRVVAPSLGLPLFSKDMLKEIIFDQMGWSSRAWSQRVGAASWELLWKITEQELRASRSIAIESNFAQPAADERIIAFRVKFPVRAIELHCVAKRQVIIDRFIERAQSSDRHSGHCEAEPAHLYGEFVPRLRDADDVLLTSTDGALRVDTTVPEAIDTLAITARLRALLWPETELLA